jgi:dephospho-CoA kinase
MLRVGLTGGLASGKSFVGRVLEDLGCRLLRADDLGHQVLQPDGAAYAAVVAEFGPDILEPDGTIARRRLAAEVFDKPERLDALNRLVHPPVIALQEAWIERVAAAEPGAIAVVEAAILIETGSHKRFDKLIVAVCTPEQQIERAMKRDQMTRAEAAARVERQMPLAERLRYADFVVDTSREKEHAIEQVHAVYAALRRVQQ